MSQCGIEAPVIDISEFISDWRTLPFGHDEMAAWDVTTHAVEILNQAIKTLSGEYVIEGDVATHVTATVEKGAVVKGPAILGPHSFVAASAYLRGGVFLDKNCIVGPACELKTTFMVGGSKVAHLSFVGDSLVGARANIEAGAIVANYRNEMDNKQIRIVWRGRTVDTGIERFGALIGDDVRIGANSVIAPGAIIEPGFQLTRLGKIGQHPNRFT